MLHGVNVSRVSRALVWRFTGRAHRIICKLIEFDDNIQSKQCVSNHMRSRVKLRAKLSAYLFYTHARSISLVPSLNIYCSWCACVFIGREKKDIVDHWIILKMCSASTTHRYMVTYNAWDMPITDTHTFVSPEFVEMYKNIHVCVVWNEKRKYQFFSFARSRLFWVHVQNRISSLFKEKTVVLHMSSSYYVYKY